MKGENMQLTEGDDWLVDQLVEALALSRRLNERLKAHIKKHEWTKPNEIELRELNIWQFCSECGRFKSEGHAPDCERKRLLEE